MLKIFLLIDSTSFVGHKDFFWIFENFFLVKFWLNFFRIFLDMRKSSPYIRKTPCFFFNFPFFLRIFFTLRFFLESGCTWQNTTTSVMHSASVFFRAQNGFFILICCKYIQSKNQQFSKFVCSVSFWFGYV